MEGAYVHLVATRCASGFRGFLSPFVSFRTRFAFSVSSIFFNRLLRWIVMVSCLVERVRRWKGDILHAKVDLRDSG